MMKVIHWLPAAGFAVLIFAFSHQSRPPGADLGPDYLLHALSYAAFGLTLVWGRTAGLSRPLGLGGAVVCWGLATAYGALDEFHQSYIPLRTASASDLFADSLGAGMAVLAAWFLLRLVRPRPNQSR